MNRFRVAIVTGTNAMTGPVMASRAIKREQMPEDLIKPLPFLATDDCQFMTGNSVVVDG